METEPRRSIDSSYSQLEDDSFFAKVKQAAIDGPARRRKGSWRLEEADDGRTNWNFNTNAKSSSQLQIDGSSNCSKALTQSVSHSFRLPPPSHKVTPPWAKVGSFDGGEETGMGRIGDP